jgi:predicted GIY-YIG superfamily endonuclease
MRSSAKGESKAGCYLLHFDASIYGAQHYLGWALDITRRVKTQLSGRGARLVRQALAAGLGVELVRTWPDADLRQERVLKRRGPKSYCPRCRGATKREGA